MLEPETEEEIGSEIEVERSDAVEDLELESKHPTLFLQGIAELQLEEEEGRDTTRSGEGLLVGLNFLGSCSKAMSLCGFVPQTLESFFVLDVFNFAGSA
ncbi:melanoma inhibitory activity protein 2 [Lasius niger]|uniref:Melanoma inhibitory activity protein 2 n=1 Tax=Lasius niger TaxID=67767 RepID=A0A0J7K5M1_LASNI|nr:melanoma inhibitory activity protein 2 [Lasius niger]